MRHFGQFRDRRKRWTGCGHCRVEMLWSRADDRRYVCCTDACGRSAMSSFVLDTSVTMSWFFEDEATPSSIAILDVLRARQALVPSLWPLEVANVLLVAERRGRTNEARSSRFVALLNSLPIVVDPAT